VSNFFLDEGIPTKLVKHAVILKSGIYKYGRAELPVSLGSVPDKHKDRLIFSVYRPPEAVKDAYDKKIFTRMPLTVGHPGEDITPENFKDHAVGLSGDTTVYDFKDGVATLATSLTIIDKEGIQSYNDGIREVSPGYDGISIWQDGVTPEGEPYQILLKEFVNPNHLAIVEMARGGKKIRILDGGDKLEKLRMSDVVQAVGKIFGVKAKYLDGMDEGDYSDEDKEYLFKELHKLLKHAADGKLQDYRPEGFGKGRAESKEAGDQKGGSGEDKEEKANPKEVKKEEKVKSKEVKKVEDGEDLAEENLPDGEAGADDPTPLVEGEESKDGKEVEKVEDGDDDDDEDDDGDGGGKESREGEEDKGGKKLKGNGKVGSKPTFHDDGKHVRASVSKFEDSEEIDFDALIRRSTLSNK
jgi:hypothetical protein